MIIADTGFFVALGNRRDRHHQSAMGTLDRIKEPLITTYPVVTETCQLLQARTTQKAQCLFLQKVVVGTDWLPIDCSANAVCARRSGLSRK